MKRLWPLVAVASGILWALCFGRRGLVVAPWVALVPWLLLFDRSRPALCGFLHGLAYWSTALVWISHTLRVYGALPPVVAVLGLLAAAAYLALYSALFGWLGVRIWRRGPLAATLGLPALWVTLETLRGRGPLAFPWNLAAYAWSEVPGALPLTAWIGSWGVSFLVVAVNVGVACSIARRDWRPATATLGLAAVLLGAGVATAPAPPAPGDSAPIAHLLQPDSPISTDFRDERVRAGYRQVLAQSRAACAAQPTLLVWPESAAWPLVYPRHQQLRRDVHELAARGCPVLLNSPAREGDAAYNAVYLVTAGRPDQRYEKRRLVPFGEYVPLPAWLPGLATISRGGGFSAGRGWSLLEWGSERLGVAICFEIVFPAQVAQQVRRGATALVTVTNDGWYGDSSAPWQHFRAARFRAAENRRMVLRAAITGVSGVIANDGQVASRLGVGERGTLSPRVAGDTRLTFFSRFPWLVPALCWGILPFAIFRSGKAGRKS